MSCANAVYNPAAAGLCLSWVQDVAGLPHVGASAIEAWSIYAGSRTSNPQPGDLVFFDRAPSNQYFGHVGIYQGGNLFRSEWTNGNICTEYINQFAAENQASVLGYVSVAQLKGQPAAASSPVAVVQSAVVPLTSVTSSAGGALRWVVLGGLGLFALSAVGDAFD